MIEEDARKRKWDIRFLKLAEHISSWSLDPSRKIGAVAVNDDRRILATGYNGFPKGISDSGIRLENREEKYKYVVHAEMNCIYNATHQGVSLNDSTLYVTGLPVCSECAKGIISVGIKKVVMKEVKDVPQIWLDHWVITQSMLNEAGVCTHIYSDDELFASR